VQNEESKPLLSDKDK